MAGQLVPAGEVGWEQLSAVARADGGYQGCVQQPDEDVRILASVITLARTVGCLTFVTVSIATEQVSRLFIGFAMHVVGDVADGIVARRRHEETRAGALVDILCDRLCVSAQYLSYG